MRRWATVMLAATWLAACSKKAAVPCADQATCVPLGAVCVDGFCRKPDEIADLGLDFSIPLDLATPPDLTPAPMCIDDTGCTTPTTPICDPVMQTCRACMSGECAGTTPICLTDGADAGSCVECGVTADCAATRTLCDPGTHTCVPCTANAQCTSGVCDAGACAAEDSILRVDINQAPCTGADGSAAKPFCQISDAVSVAKQFIVVSGSVTHYDTFTLTDTGPIRRIIGPAKSATPPALVDPSSANNVAMEVAPMTGQLVAVSIEGLWFTSDTTGIPTPPAIDCTNAGGGAVTLTLVDVTVGSNAGNGITSVGCSITVGTSTFSSIHGAGIVATAGSLTVKRSSFSNNQHGALEVLSGGSYVIENSIFSGNSAAHPGNTIYFADDATGTFRFNELVGNATAGNGAVQCGAGANKLMESSWLYDNGTVSFAGNCTYANVVTPTGDPSATTHASVVYDINHKLVAGNATNTACCFDKVSSGPAVDYAGTARPLGASWDIGPYEVQ